MLARLAVHDASAHQFALPRQSEMGEGREEDLRAGHEDQYIDQAVSLVIVTQQERSIPSKQAKDMHARDHFRSGNKPR